MRRCAGEILAVGLVLLGTGLASYAQCTGFAAQVQQLARASAETPARIMQRADTLRAAWSACGSLPDSLLIRLCLIQGRAHLALRQYAAAADVFRRAFERSHSPANESWRAQTAYLWGAACLYDNKPGPARRALLQAVRQAMHRHEDRSWGGQALVNLAYLSRTGGDYGEVFRQTDRGLDWANALHDTQLQRALLREKTLAQYETGRYEAAIQTTRLTIRLAERERDLASLGQYYQLLGDISNRQQQFEVAIVAYQRAMQYADQLADTDLKAVLLTNLGFMHYSRRDYTAAVRAYERALAIQTRPYSRVRLFDNLGACWWQMGQFDKGLRDYERGFATLWATYADNDPARNPGPALLRVVAQKKVLLTLLRDKADTWLDYAKATHNHPQRLRNALAAYQTADQMIDYMRWEHTGQESKLYWRQQTRSLYERAIETCYRLGDAGQAFRFFEKSRSVMLADKINELGARQQLSPQQSDREEKLRADVAEQQSKLAGIVLDSSAYRPNQDKLFTKQENLDLFLKQLEESNPAYYRYKYDTTTTQLAQLQPYLKVRQASFVTYFAGDSALYVLGVTGNGATLLRQPVGNYQANVRAFMELLANPDALNRKAGFGQFLALGNALYRELLRPLRLPAGRVIVSPDGTFVPFGAVSRSATRPDYLLTDYAFSYVYSASLLLKSKVGSAASVGTFGPDFVGVAPVSFAPALKQVSLPSSDDALAPIAARFGSAQLLTHQAATRRAFLKQAVGGRVIHLFTHALADDSTGREPLLYFADSTLQLSDLGDNGLPGAELVVLAACKTGVGTNQRGEGVFSLARGFAALGAPSVLTTLWSVENKATYQITDLFYGYLAGGLPKDEALQRAQRDWLRQAEGENQLPNYWAGLIIVGDTEPLGRPARWPWVVGGGLLVGAAVLAVWQWPRKRRKRTGLRQ